MRSSDPRRKESPKVVSLCQAPVAGTAAGRHSEDCRKRMEAAVAGTEGRMRKEHREESENEMLSRHMEKTPGDENGEERANITRREKSGHSEWRSCSPMNPNVRAPEKRGGSFRRRRGRRGEDEEEEEEPTRGGHGGTHSRAANAVKHVMVCEGGGRHVHTRRPRAAESRC